MRELPLRADVALELSAHDFAAAIGVKAAALPALERAGLPFKTKPKATDHSYELPRAVTWYVDFAVKSTVGGVPPRTTQKELAVLVGYSPRQISNLVDEKVVTTVMEDGKRLYPLPMAVHEVMAHREKLARGKADAKKLTPLDEAKLQKAQADAKMAELDLLERRGELIDRVLAARAIGELLQAFRAIIVEWRVQYEADFVGLMSRVKVRAVLRPATNSAIQRAGAEAAKVGRRIQAIGAQTDDDETDDGEDRDE